MIDLNTFKIAVCCIVIGVLIGLALYDIVSTYTFEIIKRSIRKIEMEKKNETSIRRD